MIIEEMLNQRILGVKNEKVYISHPLSPKLIYVLEKTIFMRTANTGILQIATQCTAET